MKLCKMTMLILTFLLTVNTEAQSQQAPHVCGAGPGPNEVQAGVQPGGNGMAPTPLCYWKQGQSSQPQSAPSQPTGWWEKTWGAIATSESGGALGTALGASTREEALEIALADCKAKGGGGCEAEFAYFNQCAAMVLGTKFLRMYGAENAQIAANRGLSECGHRDCRVYYSACTEPVFHRY